MVVSNLEKLIEYSMKSNDLDLFTALILIKKVESFRDSYSLTKVLAWKFDIISVLDITGQLKTVGLIKEVFKNGNKQYEITDKGLEYVEANMAEGKNDLINKYTNEQEFIKSLFS